MNEYDDYPVNSGGLSTEHAAAVLVIGSLIILIAIRKGFTGVNVAGVTVGIK